MSHNVLPCPHHSSARTVRSITILFLKEFDRYEHGPALLESGDTSGNDAFDNSLPPPAAMHSTLDAARSVMRGVSNRSVCDTVVYLSVCVFKFCFDGCVHYCREARCLRCK